MAYEQRDNSGSLFKNEQKEQPNHADYKGKCMIDGKMYFFDAWIKKPEGKKPFMSVSFKEMQAPDTRTIAERRQKPPVADDAPPF